MHLASNSRRFLVSMTIILVLFSANLCTAQQQQLPACPVNKKPEEIYMIGDGRDYRGTVHTTVSGLVCQRWDTQAPHAHDTKLDPALGIGNHNYCRNPFSVGGGGQSAPGCFTSNPNVRFELCNVGQPCNGSNILSRNATVLTATILPTGTNIIRGETLIRISCSQPEATVRYSTDGRSTPSQVYTGPFTLSGSALVSARCVLMRVGATESYGQLVWKRFAVKPPRLLPVAFFPSPSSANSNNLVYDKPVLVRLSVPSCNSSDCAIHYTLDKTVPTLDSALYTEPFWLTARSTIVYAVAYSRSRLPSPPVFARYDVSGFPTARAPMIYPSNGSYYGPIKLLLVGGGQESRVRYLVGLNSTTAASSLASPRHDQVVNSNTYLLKALGRTFVTVHTSSIFDGDSPKSTSVFNILPVPTVEFSKAGGKYTNQVTVYFNFARTGAIQQKSPYDDVTPSQFGATVFGRPTNGRLEVLINGVQQERSSSSSNSNSSSEEEEEARTPESPWSVMLSHVGTFNVTAYVRTALSRGPIHTEIFTLNPSVSLAPQTNIERDARVTTFVAPLFVSFQRFSSTQTVESCLYKYASDVSLSSSSATLLRCTRVTALSFAENALQTPMNVSFPGPYMLSSRYVPSDPKDVFTMSSPWRNVSFEVLQSGAAQTAYMKARVTAESVLSAMRRTLQLPSAAAFLDVLYDRNKHNNNNGTEGQAAKAQQQASDIVFRITGLPSVDIAALYQSALASALSSSSMPPVAVLVDDTKNNAAAAPFFFPLARCFKISQRTMPAEKQSKALVMLRSPFQVIVRGTNASALVGYVKPVPVEVDCAAVAPAYPIAMTPSAQQQQQQQEAATANTLKVYYNGKYKMCARIATGYFYEVPFCGGKDKRLSGDGFENYDQLTVSPPSGTYYGYVDVVVADPMANSVWISLNGSSWQKQAQLPHTLKLKREGLFVVSVATSQGRSPQDSSSSSSSTYRNTITRTYIISASSVPAPPAIQNLQGYSFTAVPERGTVKISVHGAFRRDASLSNLLLRVQRASTFCDSKNLLQDSYGESYLTPLSASQLVSSGEFVVDGALSLDSLTLCLGTDGAGSDSFIPVAPAAGNDALSTAVLGIAWCSSAAFQKQATAVCTNSSAWGVGSCSVQYSSDAENIAGILCLCPRSSSSSSSSKEYQICADSRSTNGNTSSENGAPPPRGSRNPDGYYYPSSQKASSVRVLFVILTLVCVSVGVWWVCSDNKRGKAGETGSRSHGAHHTAETGGVVSVVDYNETGSAANQREEEKEAQVEMGPMDSPHKGNL